jgi:hypothetical protein
MSYITETSCPKGVFLFFGIRMSFLGWALSDSAKLGGSNIEGGENKGLEWGLKRLHRGEERTREEGAFSQRVWGGTVTRILSRGKDLHGPLWKRKL